MSNKTREKRLADNIQALVDVFVSKYGYVPVVEQQGYYIGVKTGEKLIKLRGGGR